ncbi:hypothetical protein FNAPI_6160 [Fusarium napiforme]|uniref:DUF7580 domain-containing protein n=1 Tax=Fusarium napiforme TaxID=42672 RepID=A0A8H5JH80_9HYPO|nr:hypothetical protein FNAPI_6160 [Fusarium napiforme]
MGLLTPLSQSTTLENDKNEVRTMSGFEVVGIVLGTLPLVVTALEAYSNLLRDWGKAPAELRSLNRQLSTERVRLCNVCEQLISDVVSQRDIEPMLEDPFGPLWQAKQTNDRIRRRLWDSYGPFEDTVKEVEEALQSVMMRLRIDVSADGTVQWIDRKRVTRDFKKLLYRLNRKDYQEALETISKGITSLEGLTQQSVGLESRRRKQSRCKVFKVLRDLSASFYRALCSSILCTDSHDVSLELATRFIEVGHECDDEKIIQNAQFRLAISFEVEKGPTSKMFWDEVNIQAMSVSMAVPAARCGVATKTKSSKRVSFGIDRALSRLNLTETATEVKPNVKTAMAILARPATDIAFIKCPEESSAMPTISPLDLCLALKKAHQERPACYGHLIDKEYSHRHFQVCPLGPVINSDGWSIVTLEDVLEGKQGLRPLISLAEKVRLALVIASSVLQLSKTAWLPEALTPNNVHFFRRGSTLSYEHPFLRRRLPEYSFKRLNDAADSRGYSLSSNPTLLALGMLLLEIILGSSLKQLQIQDEKSLDGDNDGLIRDLTIANRMLEQRVALINPAYKAVVERCIGCTDSKELDKDDFRQTVYNGVVMELEAIWDHTKLGTRTSREFGFGNEIIRATIAMRDEINEEITEQQMSDPQQQSTFTTLLPREIRDKIYLELWRSCGLRQHIIWHRNKDGKAKSHFCRWRCTTPFSVQEELQETIDTTRIQLGIPLGGSFSNKAYALQLYSAWKNHFACGQRIAEVYGEGADPGIRTCSSLGPCWRSHSLSSEKLSTCSAYMNVFALNMFVGFCKVPDLWKQEVEGAISPPAFRTYGRHLEISLEPVFPMLSPCSSPTISPLPGERHTSLDFHGLRLDLLENLTTLNIWVPARCTELLLDKIADNIDQSPYNITQLDLESLKEALSSLNHVRNVTLSMSLTQVSEPEDGYVVDDAQLRIWRRGAGDRFHPSLLPVIEVERLSSNVYSSTKRYIGSFQTSRYR